MLRILSLLAIATITAAQNGCTSLSTLVHGTNGAPAGLGTPDCSYIQANAAAICNTLGAWDIINGDACQMRGPGYGCQFSNTVFTTQETFYCQLGPAAAVATASPSASASASASGIASFSPSASASATPTPSASASATPTPSGSASATPTPSASATPTPSGSASTSPLATSSSTLTVTATSTSTHTIKPVYIYINTTTLVPVTVMDTSIGKGQAAAIGLAAIFGTFTVGCLCLVFIMRRRPAEKEQLSSRRPSMIVRDPPSHRPSTVLKSEV